jgi:hypothetical protein
MDPLLELLGKIRAVYVKRLEAELGRLHREHGNALLIQPLLEAEGNELPSRLDAAIFGAGKVEAFSIEPATMLAFEPVVAAWSGDTSRQLTITAFSWDAARMTVTTDAALDVQPIRDWFRKWITPPDNGGPGTPHPVVHFMTEPETIDREVRFSIDLGTAPAPAVHELIMLCFRSGGTSVRLEHDH